MRGVQIRPSHGARCTNPTFSRTYVLHARLYPTRVFVSFGSSSKVLVFDPVLPSGQSPPSVIRRWSSRIFAGLGLWACASEWSTITLGHPKARSFVTFGFPKMLIFDASQVPSAPKVGFSLPGVLIGTEHPSGAHVTQHRGPADGLGDVFEAWINLRVYSRRSNPQHLPSRSVSKFHSLVNKSNMDVVQEWSKR